MKRPGHVGIRPASSRNGMLWWCFVIVAAGTIVSITLFPSWSAMAKQTKSASDELMPEDAARIRTVTASLAGFGRRREDGDDLLAMPLDDLLASACVDTPGWTNKPGPGHDCAAYEQNKWCVSKKAYGARINGARAVGVLAMCCADTLSTHTSTHVSTHRLTIPPAIVSNRDHSSAHRHQNQKKKEKKPRPYLWQQ